MILMEFLFVLLALYVVAVLFVLPIWTFFRFQALKKTNDGLARDLAHLEHEFKDLRRVQRPTGGPKTEPSYPSRASQPSPPILPPRPEWSACAPSAPPLPQESPILEPPGKLGKIPVFTDSPQEPSCQPDPQPVTICKAPVRERDIPNSEPSHPSSPESINWEQFLGAKLFAWLGGLALFLAVAFFVKYSFEHDLIPPAVRVAIGFLIGAGLVVGGLKICREKYAITAQTLIAAGIVSLYSVTFACRSLYHFEFFGPVPTFLLMSLITATAFILAVRLDAPVVAILGILGGFLTPCLLSTGADNPAGLFGYIALLDIGLAAVALHRRWFYLVPLGACGTVIMMVGWAGKFYVPGNTVTAMAVCLGFSALFIGIVEAARWTQRQSLLLGQCAIGLLIVSFFFAWSFLGYHEVAVRTWLFFGYVILLSSEAFFLEWRKGQDGLVAGVAGFTALLLVNWAARTFHGSQAPVLVTVCLVFSAIYFIVYLLARRWERATLAVLWAAVGMSGVSLAFALFLIHHQAVGANPGLLFLFILAGDGLLLALAWLDERLPKLHLFAGFSVFALLSLWTAGRLTGALLPWALAMYLVFAALHTVFPVLLERKRPMAVPTWWSQIFPPLSLLLMLLPILRLEVVSFLLWPAILLVDLIAVALAVLSASMMAVVSVLVLTLLAAGLTLFRIPVAGGLDLTFLLVVGGFAIFFFAASLWLARKIGPKLADADREMSSRFGDPRTQLPAMASLLPFLLLIMACARLPMPDPSPVFGLGLLLVVLTLGLSSILLRSNGASLSSDSEPGGAGIQWLPACALAGIAALELVWHTRHFTSAAPGGPLAWYLGFYAVFALYPFLFRRDFSRMTGPWAVAAMSGLAQFWMAYQAIKTGWPSAVPFLGMVPAFFALAPLASLGVILRTVGEENPKRFDQLAWFGGVALFFITLIFPIQFDRQWLTVAWALEGAALFWLFHRVPHPALRATGLVLQVVAFVRLALNPAVLGYHARGGIGIFNWYLYAYGVTTVALFVGAWLLAPPRERVLGISAPPLLNALGAILAFLLLNLEIADYFTEPGSYSLVFQFSGNFARDLSYTIGWALFALALLAAGIWHHTKAARVAAIVLLCSVLLKLFFHDLASLDALYRIGALFGVAVIAMIASFAYQRFLPIHDKGTA